MIFGKSIVRPVHAVTVALLLLAACASGQKTQIVTASSDSDIIIEQAIIETAAERSGRHLFDRYQHPEGSKPLAVKTAQGAIPDTCRATFDFVVIPAEELAFPTGEDPQRDSLIAYAIGKATGSIMLGRHYRIELSPSGDRVRSIKSSTRECTIMPMAKLTKSTGIDRRYAQGPTEFDVFLSLLHGTAYRVRTEMGTWKIDRGEAKLIALDPAYRVKPSGLIQCQMPQGYRLTTTEAACRSGGGTIVK